METKADAARARRVVAFVFVLACCLGGAQPVGASGPAADPFDGWDWPLAASRIVAPYAAPEHRYAPGHRGIDVRPVGDATVVAPEAGVVAFAGVVVDRSLITIDHGGGVVSTLEPVEPVVAVGAVVERGAIIGAVSAGGHAATGTLHLGVRVDGEYVNPLLFLGGVRRAVLLPCC
ncbi:peptidoglycan DD-metalloendopeptidase family protein [Microbacterium sp. NPDC055910]|uniref:peptidoglycan DD-metalloendopeptidase family protein n=1 Tax=Microbacterium sp. NPDC055910 TaxID=3345659 RepID=UPI0035DC6F6A